MTQVFCVVQPYISYGGNDTYWPLLAGAGSAGTGLDPLDHHVPLAFPATVRNLVVYTVDPLRLQEVTVTVLKNGVATGLTVTLGLDDTVGTITGVDVEFAVFDEISFMAVTAGSHVAFGFTIGVCVEIECDGNVYGIPQSGGTARAGGALGNGIDAPWAGVGFSTNSYSICAVPGNLTRLVLKDYTGAVPTGTVVTGWIVLNEVVQDGSGATVDTSCVIPEGDTTAMSEFTLPIVPGDRVFIAWVRSGVSQQVAAGVGFVPTTDGYFMLCGGSNNLVGDYIWNTVDQDNDDEELASVVVSASGLVARGLYVERSSAPGAGEEYTHTLRRSNADTSIVVDVADTEMDGLIASKYEEYLEGDKITIQVAATAGAVGSSQFHWGLAATSIGVDVPQGEIGPLLWVEWPRLVP